MTPIIPIINLNGESLEKHIEYRINAREAVGNAMKALSELRPHGRDYPGVEGNKRFEQDLEEYRSRFAPLVELYEILLDEAVELKNGD